MTALLLALLTSFPNYVYSDTSNSQLNESVLTKEINALGITSATFQGINAQPGAQTFEVLTDVEPSSADKTSIDNAVAAHVGGPLMSKMQRKISYGSSTNTTTTPADKINIQANPLEPGNYLIVWLAEINTDTPGSSGCKATILLNSVERSQTSNTTDAWILFSGTAILPFDAGDTPTLQLQFVRTGDPATASIRRAYVSISRIGEVEDF